METRLIVRNPRDTVRRSRHGVRLSSKAASGDLFEDANRLWKEGRFAEAERAYREILEQKPNSAWALYRLGELKKRAGDLKAADEMMGRALALNPSLAQSGTNAPFWQRFKFANDLLEQRNQIAAERIFRELLAQDIDCAPVLAKLGRIEGEHGRIQEALAFYDRAICSDGSYVWGHIGRAEMLDAAGDLDAAMRVLQCVLERDPGMALAQDRLRALRQRRRVEMEGVALRHWPATARRDGAADGPRVAVVGWCLAHNPVGRAMILADLAKSCGPCEIVGPIFPSYGDDLWPPLRDGARNIDIHGFVAPSFQAFMEGAIRLVNARPAEVAWVSKPRLPGLLIGFLYKLIHGASLIVDIDDDELAFVKAEGALTLDEFLQEQTQSDWREPHARRWTQLAVSMAASADAVTVCNPVLQRRFGGTVIRHARDARQFDEARARRDAVRGEFGFAPDDKVVLFLGTPRRHKGVLDVAEALRTLGDKNAVFAIIGTVLDKELRKELEAFEGVRIKLFPDQPYARLAEMNAMADVVCVLQDPDDPISQSQTPAKLTDAIATGTAVLATAVPPMLDLMEGAGIAAVQGGKLAQALRGALGGDAQAGTRRAFFRRELSTEVNAARAREVIDAARAKNAPLPDDAMRLFAHIDASMPGSLPRDCAYAAKGAFHMGPRVGKLTSLKDGVNLVFFWKQNDSALYGRRQDMLLQQFAALPQVRRILHIDAPISADALNALASTGSASSQGRLVAANTLARFLGTADDERIVRRTFVHRGKETQLLGRELAPVEAFPNAVEAWLKELDMTSNLLAWVCPVVRGFPEVQQRLGFSFIASDVIDDQRQWPMQPAWRLQLEKNYRQTFKQTDVSFANCAPVAEWLSKEGLRPLVVPNGMDVRAGAESWDVPAALKSLPRPIVGYCGSLSHRIDWDLIEAVSVARPNWSIVLIGEPAKDDRYRQVVSRPNVHALGVLQYETALRHVAAFDVAMIPHMASALSEHMNPLKLYVYRGVGVGVVSAAIANLDDLADDIRIAKSPEDFVAKLEEAIADRRARGRVYPSAAAMQACSWQSRAARIWERLEEVFAG
jgi:glycosyltransferase involved in cell wall biosynthesis